jgi:hypothetical protein
MSDLAMIPWDHIPHDAAPDARIAADFRLAELNRSGLAARRGIDNAFSTVQELRNAVFLARNVLQPVRDRFGRFTPNSVYRSQALERALKGRRSDWVSRSQHTLGLACDIEIPGLSTRELAQWVMEELEFDQLILEHFDPRQGLNAGWVHVSLLPPGAGRNRGEVLSHVRLMAGEPFRYVRGLVGTA